MANKPAPGSGLALQEFGGTSLDTFIQSIQDLTGQQGKGILEKGQGQTQQGVNALAPSLDLLTKLTKGDQGDVTQAAQPEIDQITQQFDAIRNMVSLQPRGGGKTSALAEAPFKKAGDIQRTEGAMRTDSASKLATVGSNLAGIGAGESAIGANLESESARLALGKQTINYQQPSALQQVLSGLSTGAKLAETGASIAYLLG